MCYLRNYLFKNIDAVFSVHWPSVFTVVVNRLFDKRYYLFINIIIIIIAYFFLFCLFNIIVGFVTMEYI